MKTQNLLIVVLSLVALLLGFKVLTLQWKIDDFSYKTDTVYVSTPYPVPKPFFINVPPKELHYYHVNPTNSRLEQLNDSLMAVIIKVKGKTDTVRIDNKFLLSFPYNPKLIDLGITNDSLHIALLNTDAQLAKYSYPFNINRYNYRWVNGSLSATPVFHPNKNHKFNLSLNGFGGYSFLDKRPEAGFELRSTLSSFSISLETSATIENKPELSLKSRVGVNIKQWPKR